MGKTGGGRGSNQYRVKGVAKQPVPPASAAVSSASTARSDADPFETDGGLAMGRKVCSVTGVPLTTPESCRDAMAQYLRETPQAAVAKYPWQRRKKPIEAQRQVLAASQAGAWRSMDDGPVDDAFLGAAAACRERLGLFNEGVEMGMGAADALHYANRQMAADPLGRTRRGPRFDAGGDAMLVGYAQAWAHLDSRIWRDQRG